VEGTASLELPALTPDQVWAFIRPAESTVLLNPEVERAFTVPGTGPGVGEQQCFVSRDPKGLEVVSFLEVTAVTDGVCAEYEHTAGPVPSGGRTAVEAVAEGTKLVLSSWYIVPGLDPGSHRKAQREIELQLQSQLTRIRAVLRALYLSPGSNGLTSAPGGHSTRSGAEQPRDR
jgi:hypothetical protein